MERSNRKLPGTSSAQAKVIQPQNDQTVADSGASICWDEIVVKSAAIAVIHHGAMAIVISVQMATNISSAEGGLPASRASLIARF